MIKIFKEIFLSITILFLVFFNLGFIGIGLASEKQEIDGKSQINQEITYTFFYGNGCPHCAKVEEFFQKNNIKSIYKIDSYEVYNNNEARQKFLSLAKKLNIDLNDLGVPFLYYTTDGEDKYLSGDAPIIEYFTKLIKEKVTVIKSNSGSVKNNENVSTGEINTGKIDELSQSGTIIKNNTTIGTDFWNRMKFFLILLPAAVSDSINPCEFAIMILLLGSILTLHKDRKKVYLAGILFSLAIFLSYFLMGLGLYKALASVANLNGLKITVGIIGILVGLANMKDYFWYGKWFVMEVPFSWRPAMQNLIKKVTSPIGAFFVGIVISLFLLPCTSGPYLTVLGYLAAESKNISSWGVIYLLVYNIIFILPMLIITFLIGSGAKTPGEMREFKEANLEKIHLIVGFLMIGLGLYLLNDVYGLVKIVF